MEVNAAVAALKQQLTALQTNTDPSRNNMLKLNLREAQEALGRWGKREMWDGENGTRGASGTGQVGSSAGHLSVC